MYLPKQPSKLEETGGFEVIRAAETCSVQPCYCVNKRAAFEAEDRSRSLARSHSAEARSHYLRPEHEDQMQKNLKSALISPSWETVVACRYKFLSHFHKDWLKCIWFLSVFQGTIWENLSHYWHLFVFALSSETCKAVILSYPCYFKAERKSYFLYAIVQMSRLFLKKKKQTFYLS